MENNTNVMNYVYWRGKEVFKSNLMSREEIWTVFQVERDANCGDHINYHCFHDPK